jgi:hypothetical protein
MNLPQSIHLPTKCLSRVFDKTVATYKYYWFLGILEYIKEGKTRFTIWDVAIYTIAKSRRRPKIGY